MKTVRLFMLTAMLILVIACINYVNLATARAAKRSKEIAVRKIMGAGRGELFSQLMKEGILLFLVAFILSTLIIVFVLPFYNQLSGKEIEFRLFDLSVWRVYGIVAIGVVLMAGIYPAYMISFFKPLEAFKPKGNAGVGKGIYLRRVLVVLQFVFSFSLIVATIGIFQQLKFLREKDLGYIKEHVLVVRSYAMGHHYNAVKNELLKCKNIIGVTAADHSNMRPTSMYGGADWEGREAGHDPTYVVGFVQPNFFDVMGITLLEGNSLIQNDSIEHLYVNRTALTVMNIENPIGKRFHLNRGDEGILIVGVLKDYNYEVLSEMVKPLVLITGQYTGCMYIKTAPGGAKEAIAAVEELWKQYNSKYEFRYTFLDEIFDTNYKSDIRTGKLINIFSLIAIFTSCLGLFGLVTYTAETKTKEIGIRKTLGATIFNIIMLLSKEFLLLVGVSILVALPLSYYLLDVTIIRAYAYHISLSWWIFAIAILVTTLLTLLTVSAQALRAARTNPVKAIKTE